MGVCVLSADTGGILRVTKSGLIALAILTPLASSLPVGATTVPTTTTVPTVRVAKEAVSFYVPTRAQVELRKQMRHPKTPSVAYWQRVAQCETASNWRNGGNWAGGLGIARSTWQGYGGRAFARTPDKATVQEQLVIANRIAVFGYQTKKVFMTFEDRAKNRPFFRPPVGFNGWGCIKNTVGPPKVREDFKNDYPDSYWIPQGKQNL